MKNFTHTTSFRNFFGKVRSRKIDQMAANRQLLEYIRGLEEQIMELDMRVKALEPKEVMKKADIPGDTEANQQLLNDA